VFPTETRVVADSNLQKPMSAISNFGANESIEIGKSQRLCKEGNLRINKASAMRLGSVMIIGKVSIPT
jgi:hypothetical protein